MGRGDRNGGEDESKGDGSGGNCEVGSAVGSDVVSEVCDTVVLDLLIYDV